MRHIELGNVFRSTRPLLLGALSCVLMSACADAVEPCGEDCAVTPPAGLDRAFNQGTLTHQVTPRAGWGGLKVRVSGGTTYVLETTRDSQSGFTRRLVAYASASQVLWTLAAAPQEHFSDFAVHPSGELSLAVERTDAERGGYELVRLSAGGEVLSRQPVPEPATVPAGDVGAKLPPRPFRMKSTLQHALTDGWLRTEARGEDLVVAFLSLVDEPREPTDRSPIDVVSAVMALRWSEARYAEQWTRMVDGRHEVDPVAWAYDEFRWREAPARPLLAVDGDGTVVVGRTWSQLRCLASSETFQTPTKEDCVNGEDVTTHMDVEYQPFALTSFSASGERGETHSFLPGGVMEFLVFDMAVRGGDVALAGSVVRQNGGGGIDYYPPFPGSQDRMAPYDAYLGVIARSTGALRFEHDLGGPRADHFSSLRWTEEGLLAAGATGWDRWSGGMSITRGAGPLLALVTGHGSMVRLRTAPLDGGQRHFNLLGVDIRDGAVVAVGLADAPMTHSGDGGQQANMTFGGLTLELR